MLIVFNSTSHAIRAERVLLDRAIKAVVMPLPARIRAGCGICLRVEDHERVIRVLKEFSIAFEVHQLSTIATTIIPDMTHPLSHTAALPSAEVIHQYPNAVVPSSPVLTHHPSDVAYPHIPQSQPPVMTHPHSPAVMHPHSSIAPQAQPPVAIMHHPVIMPPTPPAITPPTPINTHPTPVITPPAPVIARSDSNEVIQNFEEPHPNDRN